VNYYTVPPEDLVKWSDTAGKPVIDNWLKSMKAKGFTVAPQIVEEMGKLVKQYSPK
jgi:hypothetical protein